MKRTGVSTSGHNTTDIATGTTSSTLHIRDGEYYPGELIETILEEGQITLVYKAEAQAYLTGYRKPPKVWKDIYKVEKIKTVEGEYFPATQPQIIFNDK